jgi:hypothetical protein
MHFITYFIFVVFSTPTRIPHSFIDTNKNLHGQGMTILFNLSIRPNFFLQKKPCLINDVTISEKYFLGHENCSKCDYCNFDTTEITQIHLDDTLPQ